MSDNLDRALTRAISIAGLGWTAFLLFYFGYAFGAAAIQSRVAPPPVPCGDKAQ